MLLIGHKKQRDFLEKSLKESKLLPVMIFHGPSGIGKKRVALELIQKDFCKNQNACGECPPCKKVANLEHENLYSLEPEGKFIKIESIRELLKKLSLKNLSERRYIIIDNCEKLNPQAANALLKTLEEPPTGSHFILITSNLNRLMETIRSRAIALIFKNLDNEEMQPLLKDSPQWMLRACQGRPGLFYDLQENETLQERKLALEILETSYLQSRFEAFQKIKSWVQEKPNWDRVFFFMQSFLRDVKVIKIQKDRVINSDKMDFIQKASQLDESFVDQWFLATQNLENQFFSNQDKSLCLENFWLESSKSCVSMPS